MPRRRKDAVESESELVEIIDTAPEEYSLEVTEPLPETDTITEVTTVGEMQLSEAVPVPVSEVGDSDPTKPRDQSRLPERGTRPFSEPPPAPKDGTFGYIPPLGFHR